MMEIKEDVKKLTNLIISSMPDNFELTQEMIDLAYAIREKTEKPYGPTGPNRVEFDIHI